MKGRIESREETKSTLFITTVYGIVTLFLIALLFTSSTMDPGSISAPFIPIIGAFTKVNHTFGREGKVLLCMALYIVSCITFFLLLVRGKKGQRVGVMAFGALALVALAFSTIPEGAGNADKAGVDPMGMFVFWIMLLIPPVCFAVLFSCIFKIFRPDA